MYQQREKSVPPRPQESFEKYKKGSSPSTKKFSRGTQ